MLPRERRQSGIAIKARVQAGKEDRPMRIVRRTAMFLAAVMVFAIGLSGPAVADQNDSHSQPNAIIKLNNLQVLDSAGRPFPVGTAGVIACPLEGFSVPCGHLLVGGADAQGNVLMEANPTVSYRFTGFVFNTGWPCPAFISPDGNAFWFSDPHDVFASEIARPTTFVIRQPDPSECA
jgi:hypothetical protein